MILYLATSMKSHSVWLVWKLNDQCPFQPLVNKRGKAVIPAQDWPS